MFDDGGESKNGVLVVFWEVSRSASRRGRIRDGLPTEHPVVLDEIEAALAGLPEAQELSSEQVVGSLAVVARIRNRAEAYLTALAGEADIRTLGQVFAAGTTGTMVAAATGSNPAAGAGIVATARALRDLPHVAAAFAAGRLSGWHVTALRHAAPRIHGFPTLETALVQVAGQVEPAELRRILDVLIAQCTPDGPDGDLAAQREKRGLSLSELPNGLFRLDGYLDALEGRRLRDALLAFSDRGGPDDRREATQRRADALADIVAIANANTRPLGVTGLTVLIDVENLPDRVAAALEDGQPIGPATFDLLSCTAALACVFGVHRKGTFVPLHLARTARRATAAQWAALIARDRGCIRCGRTPRGCEAHHIVHWQDGGLTDISNLVLLCSRCHRDLHAGTYTVHMDADGVPVITVNRGPPVRAG